MTHQQKALSEGNAEGLNTFDKAGFDSNSFSPSEGAKAIQCERVLAALRRGPQTTDDLRRLAVRSPASRVMELRKAGHVIVTGRAGVQARYVLIGGAA